MKARQDNIITLSGNNHADFLTSRGAERTSMFFKRKNNKNNVEYIKSGSIFRRVRSDKTIETAKILSVVSDSFNIPHVRYDLEFRKPFASVDFCTGPRVLALATFIDIYKERVFSGQ